MRRINGCGRNTWISPIIGRVSWNWNASVQKVNNEWTMTGGGKTITRSQASSTYPVWTGYADVKALIP